MKRTKPRLDINVTELNQVLEEEGRSAGLRFFS
jgi:hypothetical protein